MPRVLGIAMIIGLALPAAIRLSRMNWAWPPWRGSVLVHFEIVVAAAVVEVEYGIPGVRIPVRNAAAGPGTPQREDHAAPGSVARHAAVEIPSRIAHCRGVWPWN